MKSTIRFFKFCLPIIVLALSLVAPSPVFADLTDSQMNKFANNNILFYDPGEAECHSSFSSICGSTAKEKYWSALRQFFDAGAAAGIMGNINNEGGFNPVGVESCDYLNPFNFSTGTWYNGWTWDRYFTNDSSTTGQPTGVGAFGITSTRSAYLQHVNEVAPNLITYFQHPEKYSFGGCSGLGTNGEATGGDALLKEIGAEDFDGLVELEVQWMYKMLTEHWDFDIEKFGAMEPFDAGGYFAQHYERCVSCSTDATKNKRGTDAKKLYEEMSGFTCAGDSTRSSLSTCPVLKTGGYQSIEEAQAIIKAYVSSDISSYGLVMPSTGDLHDNCVAFSTWFINNNTDLTLTSPPNGNQIVNTLSNKYSDLEVSNEPSVYSVASWSLKGGFNQNGNHTAIIIGINVEEDRVLVAEAGWEHPEFTGVHEYRLSSMTDGQYINLNNHLKSNVELK